MSARRGVGPRDGAPGAADGAARDGAAIDGPQPEARVTVRTARVNAAAGGPFLA